MSSYLELRQKSMQKNTAGICAILNNVINLCMFHVTKYGNNDIFIYNEELFELFDFPFNDENKSNYLNDLLVYQYYIYEFLLYIYYHFLINYL